MQTKNFQMSKLGLEKEKQEGKWLSEEALQIAKDRREAKREKGKSASS